MKMEFTDFGKVERVLLREKLSMEEIQEGLEPMEEVLNLCFTGHSLSRINDQLERNCEIDRVIDLFHSKSKELFNLSLNKDVALLEEGNKLAVVGFLKMINNEISFVVKTIIRKVYINKYGFEVEKTVYFKEGIEVC